MRFQCTFCSYIIKVDSSLRGERIKCPSCEQEEMVPKTKIDPGIVIGDFVITRFIGEGSIGAVFEANQISLGRTVALKVLFQEYTNQKGIADFLKEARAAAKLSHPNVVKALSVGEEDGACFMAMELVKGESVRAKLKREVAISVDEALHITQQVSEALYYAWDEAKIIHRDVKPENIMINEEGVVKLTDLGLVMYQSEWAEDMEISGSPSYMSPEQFCGEKLDSRSDIYSLGVTLYQMLAGFLPFKGDSVQEVAKQHFEDTPKSLHKINPKIPLKVTSLVNKMMAKHPTDRYQNMEELLSSIWSVRQKTAPEKELVPDVHTISIKRLDYDLQKVSKKKKRKARIQAREEKQRYSTIIAGVVIVLVILMIPVLVLLIKSHGQRQREDQLRREIQFFQVESNKEKIDYNELQIKGNAFLYEIGKPQSPVEKELKAKVHLYLVNLKHRKLNERYDKLFSELNQLTREKVELAKSFIEVQKAYHQLDEERKRSLADATNKIKKEKNQAKKVSADISKDLRNLSNENRKLRDDLEKMKNVAVEKELRQLRIKEYAMIRKGRFKEAIAMLEVKKENMDTLRTQLLESKIDKLKMLQKIYKALTRSGSKYSGTVLDNEAKIIGIFDGLIKSHNYDGFTEKKWDDLSFENCYRVVKVAFSDTDEESLKKDLAVLRGDLTILSQAPEDSEDYQIFQAVIASTLENIRYSVSGDRKKTIAKAKLFLEKLEDHKDYEKIKDEVDIIMKKDLGEKAKTSSTDLQDKRNSSDTKENDAASSKKEDEADPSKNEKEDAKTAGNEKKSDQGAGGRDVKDENKDRVKDEIEDKEDKEVPDDDLPGLPRRD